jgi:hypothetical protein
LVAATDEFSKTRTEKRAINHLADFDSRETAPFRQKDDILAIAGRVSESAK